MEQDERSEFQRRIGVGEKQHPFSLKSGPGSSRTFPVKREDNGKVGGKTTHHWDGRQDSTVFAGSMIKKPKVGEI